LKERWLSIKQAAKITSLSARFLYEICAKKELRHFKVGKRILIDLKDLLDFVNQGVVECVDDWPEKLRLK